MFFFNNYFKNDEKNDNYRNQLTLINHYKKQNPLNNYKSTSMNYDL